MGFSDLDFFSAMLLDRDAAIKLLIKYKDNTNGIEIMAEAEIMQKTSNLQLYKQAGNSIVVDVLYYLFKNLFVNKPSIDDLVKQAKLEEQITIDAYLGGLA